MDENNNIPVPETETPAPETEIPAPETEIPAPETEAAAPGTEAPAEKKKGLPWKKIGFVAGVIAALALVFAALGALIFRGDKTTPLKGMERFANTREISAEQMYKAALNGIEDGNAARIVKLLRTSDEFEDWVEQFDDQFRDLYEDHVDEYGKNFKIRYKIDKSSAEKLDRDELKDARSAVRDLGEQYAELGKALGKLKSADLKDLAEDLELDVKDLKDLIASIKEIGSKLRGAEVSEGWTYEYSILITGSELDEAEEDYSELTVLKINGRWIVATDIYGLQSLYYVLNSHMSRYL